MIFLFVIGFFAIAFLLLGIAAYNLNKRTNFKQKQNQIELDTVSVVIVRQNEAGKRVEFRLEGFEAQRWQRAVSKAYMQCEAETRRAFKDINWTKTTLREAGNLDRGGIPVNL